MRFYEKRVFWLIIITIIFFLGGITYFYKESFELSIKLFLPLNSNNFLTFLGILITLFSGLFGWLYKLDLQEEKDKHLGYIRTINDRTGKKIDGNFFTDIKKARKFCSKEQYYILPFGFKYNVSTIDFEELEYNSIKDTEEEKIKKFYDLSLEEVLNHEEIIYVKEFLDLDKYSKHLDLHGKNEFNKDSEIIIENYIDKEKINKDVLMSFLKDGKDFVIIEGYCYLYKL